MYSFRPFILILCCTFFISHIANAADNGKVIPTGSFIGTGQDIYLKNPGITITSLKGWKGIHQPDTGVTLKMEGPAEKIKGTMMTLVFQPMFSIRTIRTSEPIDRLREISFIKELTHQFTRKTPLKHYKIESSQVIAYTPTSKAIEVIASYHSKGEKLIQQHMLIASKNHQYIMTFTDLDQLLKHDPRRALRIQKTFYSMKVAGKPAERYSLIKSTAPVSTMIALIIAFLTFFQKIYRKTKLRQIHRTLKIRTQSKSRPKPRPHKNTKVKKSSSTVVPPIPQVKCPPSRVVKTPTQKRIPPIGLTLDTYNEILDGPLPVYEKSHNKYPVDMPVLTL